MRTVGEVYGWVKLQPRRYIASEAHREIVAVSALIVQLKAPGFVEIMRPAEQQLRLILHPDRTDHPLVRGRVVTRLEERLRTRPAGGPINESGGQQPRSVLDQAHL